MTRWIVAIESNCADPAREDAFNTWYNETHLPDVLETPEIVQAIRYEALNPAEGQGKYLAVYVIDADDLQAVVQATMANVEKKAAQGRMSELLEMGTSRSYRQIYSLAK